MPTLFLSRTAACSATFSAKLVLPTDGRAARIDQVGSLEAGGERVEVLEAGRDATDLTAMRVEVVEPVVGVVEQAAKVHEAGRDAPLADGEQRGLGPIDRLLDLGGVLVADAGDLAGRTDEIPEDRLSFDDPSVGDDMDRGGRPLR